MRITLLPRARDQMEERGVSDDQVRRTLEDPDREYPGDFGRTVAERRFESRRSTAVKVVYNRG